MISIPQYVSQLLQKQAISEDMITPLALADMSEQDSREALALVESLRPQVDDFSGALASELDDVATWGYLGLYFADKIRAGVALATYRETGDEAKKQEALQLLEKCLSHWDQVTSYTKDWYKPTPHVSTQHYGEEFTEFSWELLRPQVVQDIEIAKTATVSQGK